MKTIITLAFRHLKSWRSNYHVLASFLLGAGICLKNCHGYLSFSNGIGSSVQIFEPYIIIGSRTPFLMGILLGNLLLLSDAPFISSVSKYELLRTGYKKWFRSQIMYIFLSCFLYLLYILILTSALALICSNAYIRNEWSNAMDMVAIKQTELVIVKYAFSFDFPELVLAVSPVSAAILTLIFNWLYMVFLGLIILMVNLLLNTHYGWVPAAVIHIIGYIAYANSGIGIQLRYSLLCLASPAYHYVTEFEMPSWYALCLFFILNAGMIILGKCAFSKSSILDLHSL